MTEPRLDCREARELLQDFLKDELTAERAAAVEQGGIGGKSIELGRSQLCSGGRDGCKIALRAPWPATDEHLRSDGRERAMQTGRVGGIAP